jgi:hypothetical protein
MEEYAVDSLTESDRLHVISVLMMVVKYSEGIIGEIALERDTLIKTRQIMRDMIENSSLPVLECALEFERKLTEMGAKNENC